MGLKGLSGDAPDDDRDDRSVELGLGLGLASLECVRTVELSFICVNQTSLFTLAVQ